MKYAFIFFLIFDLLILLAGCSLLFSKNPRNSVFFTKVQGKMSREKAQKTANKIAIALFAVGAAIIMYCTDGLNLKR